MMLTSCVVEFTIAEMACVSRNVRTTRSESLPAFRSNVPFLSAIVHILCSWVRKSRGSSLSRLVRTTCTKSLAANLRTVTQHSHCEYWLNAFPHILCSWTWAHRTDVHFPKRPQNVARSFRRSGPVFQSWAFALVSCYFIWLENTSNCAAMFWNSA